MLTPADLRRIATLIWYAPTALDADERKAYFTLLNEEADLWQQSQPPTAQPKETRP